MDTSKEYIKMCGAAEEIQRSRREPYDGDYYWWSLSSSVHISYTEIHDDYHVHHPEVWDYLHGKRIIWLPRQDQLQEMVLYAGLPYLLTEALSKAHIGGSLSNISFNSMEQLWLAYVMKEKYNKIWNGEKWINAKTTSTN